MKYINRKLEKKIIRSAGTFPALILTGPRRSGKTTLLQKLFPNAEYYLIESPDVVARIKHDPRSFLDEIRPPAILDEIQNVPEILNYLRSIIDNQPRKKGQWMITGSQEAPLMRGVTESMAGRAATFQLFPFSLDETKKVSLFKGGFPEILERPSSHNIWFRSYIQTYLERDIRSISSIRDLSTFRRFLSLTTSRVGQMINRSDIAVSLGVSVPTVTEWLNILEITGQIILIPPFFENFGKRLIKSSKLFLTDTGLACHLLGIQSEAELKRSPFYGPLFENFIASEIIKHQTNNGHKRSLYYFRDRFGLEVDFLIHHRENAITLLEAKTSKTLRPSMGENIQKLKKNIKKYNTTSYIIHPTGKSKTPIKSIGANIKAIPLSSLHDII
ncbi:ATP-binding protein [Verrucomicrobiota bacterium]